MGCSAEDYAGRGKGLTDEIHIHSWADATLSEVAELIQEHEAATILIGAAAPTKDVRLDFAVVYPGEARLQPLPPSIINLLRPSECMQLIPYLPIPSISPDAMPPSCCLCGCISSDLLQTSEGSWCSKSAAS